MWNVFAHDYKDELVSQSNATIHFVANVKYMASKLSQEQVLHNLRRDVPPEVLAVSPVPSHPRNQNGGRGISLPLNIIAIIISYVR